MSAGGPPSAATSGKGTRVIVIGVDPHKKTHTAVAVEPAARRARGRADRPGPRAGPREAAQWARELDEERVFALEDCRHVSGALERFLIGRGERVVRVPRSSWARREGRRASFGKSDSIDALAVARAALREPDLPEAHLDGPAREIQLSSTTATTSSPSARGSKPPALAPARPRPELEMQAARSSGGAGSNGSPAASRAPSKPPRCASAASSSAGSSELSRATSSARARARRAGRPPAPALLELPGCGTLTAAKLVAEVAGVERFSSDAKLAKLAGSRRWMPPRASSSAIA